MFLSLLSQTVVAFTPAVGVVLLLISLATFAWIALPVFDNAYFPPLLGQ
jgi:hypothetical protein